MEWKFLGTWFCIEWRSNFFRWIVRCSVSSNQITLEVCTTAILPADDNGVDLGSASYSFKDAHIQGVIHATKLKQELQLLLYQRQTVQVDNF